MSTDSWASSPGVRRGMQANRRRDTKPELVIRSLLHMRGLRYRVDYRPIPGIRNKADIVFTRRRIAIFIDGCFWHACPEHYFASKTNVEYWEPKIEQNRLRDEAVTKALEDAGWQVIRVWEHEDPALAADRIEASVRER